MSYASNLAASAQEAMPEFFDLTAAGECERLTSYPESLVFRGYTYTARPIRRSGTTLDTQLGSVRLSLDAVLSPTFRRFIANQPIEPVRVTVFRALASDLSQYVTLFSGQIRTVTIKQTLVHADCEAKSDLLSARVPRVVYQSFCNHALFDADCGLRESEWRVAGTVGAIDGSTVEVQGLDAFADGYFKGGRLRFGGDFRLVTAHAGVTLELQIPFDARLAVGSPVYAYPGCDGNPDTCRNKFGNFERFLGMPLVPSNNPVIWGF